MPNPFCSKWASVVVLVTAAWPASSALGQQIDVEADPVAEPNPGTGSGEQGDIGGDHAPLLPPSGGGSLLPGEAAYPEEVGPPPPASPLAPEPEPRMGELPDPDPAAPSGPAGNQGQLTQPAQGQPEGTPQEAELEVVEPDPIRHRFGFGSYGRVGPGTDLRGSTAGAVSVVAHAPRVVESPYLEFDFYYDLETSGPYRARTVCTVAFSESLFHYTGDFASILALRNMYAEFVYRDMLSVWAGSRMYRGDDIYLLDYWPVDNLNTLGAGVELRRERFEGRIHVGVNRLSDDFSFQQIPVADRFFGAQQVVFMDRQRLIGSLGASYRLLGPPEGPALKLKAYLEAHYLAAGTLRREDVSTEELPSDLGWTGGLQLGSWGFGERLSHANLFFRYSQGIAAYGELAVPFGVDANKQTFPRASELVLGLSVNYELGRFGVMGAGYVRRFTDADPNLYDTDDGWEMVVDARPYVVVYGPLQLALDISYQQRFPTGMSPSALELLNPAVFQLAPMIIFAPLGVGSYERPHLRVVYRLAHLNEGARDLYAFEDHRRNDEWVHYLGVQVEWWYNSSYR